MHNADGRLDGPRAVLVQAPTKSGARQGLMSLHKDGIALIKVSSCASPGTHGRI